MIFIAIDVEDGEPICSSKTEEGIKTALDEWNGIAMGPEYKIISDRKIVYDGEWIGTLERIVTYECLIADKPCQTTYKIYCIEIS